MPDRDGTSTAEFAARFPARFADTLSEARGTMAGISATAADGNGLIPPEALQRLHEIYRLRVELEIETAAVLWRAAEVVCALSDAIEALNRRSRPAPTPPRRWLGGVARGFAESRRARTGRQYGEERREARWPDFAGPRIVSPAEERPIGIPQHDGGALRPAWDPYPGGEAEAA
jgi:hypothetical protein